VQELVVQANNNTKGPSKIKCYTECRESVCRRSQPTLNRFSYSWTRPKAQFANSPTLCTEIMNAVMDALAARTTMSKQALESLKAFGNASALLVLVGLKEPGGGER
jgi:hypothetical protein